MIQTKHLPNTSPEKCHYTSHFTGNEWSLITLPPVKEPWCPQWSGCCGEKCLPVLQIKHVFHSCPAHRITILKSSIFWDITPYSPLNFNWLYSIATQKTELHNHHCKNLKSYIGNILNELSFLETYLFILQVPTVLIILANDDNNLSCF
jgi:hypothetical protein